MRIEGTGVVIESMPNISVSPISIEGGVPVTLTAADLSPYFDIDKLNFSGISKNEFRQTGRLPEGYYRFCFTVVDYQRPDAQLSSSLCASVWIVQNDPPRPNLPLCGTEIALTDIQSIVFQWSPMHTSSPNAAQNTEYLFQLHEVRPKDRDPNDVVLSTAPIYEEQTSFTNFFYGPDKPALIPGQQYVWRVRAVDILGRDLFKNNGFSEVCTFTFGQDVSLLPPENITATAEAQRRARVQWDMETDPTGYEVAYRKDGSDGNWFTTTTTDFEALINDLEPSTSYEAQVTSLLNTYRSDPSDIVYFTTPEAPEFTCGEEEVLLDPENFVPLKKAYRNSVFIVGQFDMRLLQVEGSNGTFSGMGAMYIPYFASTITCQFTNIKVNENHEMVEGDVIALTNGMADILAEWATLPPDDDDDQQDDYSNADNFEGEDIIVEGVIENITVDTATNTITIVKKDGTTEEHALSGDGDSGNKNSGGKRFTDEGENVWVVDTAGNVTKESGGNSNNGNTTDSLLFVKNTLIEETLEYLKNESLLWIENNEKGPLEEGILKRLMALPDCFPEGIEGMQYVLAKLEYYDTHKEELIALIEQDSSRKERFEFLGRKLSGEQPPYLPELTDDEWEEWLLMICPFIVPEEEEEIIISGLTRNPDVLVINETTDTLEIGINRLEIRYSLFDTLNLQNTSLEFYKLEEDDTTMVTFFSNLPFGKEIDFKDSRDNNNIGWNGKGSDGNAISTGLYRAVLTATIDKSFRNGFEDYGDFYVKGPEVPEFPLTEAQLEEIFPNTNKERIKNVVDAINKYSNEFELTTKDKMAHFLAQIGTETAGLEKLTESSNYSAKSIFKIFLKVKRTTNQGATTLTHKYCDLIEGYDCTDDSSCSDVGSYEGPNLCSTTPEYSFPTKEENGTTVPDFEAWDISKNIKSSYINSSSLFDYVYCCRLGNGAKSTNDGSTYKGIGFVHLTGKGTYEEVSNAWNEEYPNDPKEFHGSDINLLKTNIDVAIKASLIYWKMKEINGMINDDDNDLLEVTAKVNLGYYANYVTTNTVNGYDQRKDYYDKAKETL